MSKFKVLFSKLEQLLMDRIQDFNSDNTINKSSSEVLLMCANNQSNRKGQLHELPSNIYACLNKEYAHNSAAAIIKAIADLSSIIFCDALPKYKAAILAKPKLQGLFVLFKRFFIETFNLNSLLIIEKLQSANYYTQIFSLNILIKQLIQVSSQTYLSRIRKRQQNVLETSEGYCIVPITSLQQSKQTEQNSKKQSLTSKTDRRVALSVISCKYPEGRPLKHNCKENEKKSKSKIILQQPNSSTQGSNLILSSMPKQLSIALNRKNSVKRTPLVDTRHRALKSLNICEGIDRNTPVCESVIDTVKHKLSRENSIERKMQLMGEMYNVLTIDPRNIKELATIDQKHFKTQIKQNARLSIHSKLSSKSISGASFIRG